ncbi:hypothetical protein ACIQZM_18505 [Peribacillus sp. NPDC097206]|uniref:hypothetical protein n=1 Tax=Peribacillus sp. NPDC097206 TaxID=3364398 RepID=UPI0038127773
MNLDPYEYSSKPVGFDIGAISKRIVNHQVDIDVKELADSVIKGKTFTPASFKSVDGECKRTNKNWDSQQIVALDFDEGFTLEEAYKDSFFIEHAAFLYTTFSHTNRHHKFRIVFILEEPMTEYKEFESLMNFLLDRYPYADKACKDGSRLFFGGRKVIAFNYDNRLSVEAYIDRTPLQDIKSNLNMSCNTPQALGVPNPETWHNRLNSNIELIITRDVFALQEVLNINQVILSKNEVLDYLKKQDLGLFLSVEYQSNFIDIFHDESSPSASIYKSSKGNEHWLYKCHSQSHPFVGTIIHVVQRLLDCTMLEARDFLIEVYDIVIYESEAVREFKEAIEIYKDMLLSDELEDIHPYFYKVFNTYGHLMDFYVLLDLAQEYISDDEDPRIIFYHSIRTLANKFGRSNTSTGTRMNFFTLFRMINKLDEKEVPSSILRSQLQSKQKNHYQYRNSTYELPLYTYDFFSEIDEMCRVWLEKGCTSRTISYEGVYRTFGGPEADRVFPQDKGKEIAEINQDIVGDIHQVTLNLISEKGWTTEKEIIGRLTYFFKGQQEFKTKQLKRCIGEMLEAYDLELMSSNKKVKEEMGITEDHLTKFSFPKIIRPKKDLEVDGRPLQG